MTFSIVAFDPNPSPPEWGVAVASKFLAVGAVVPWARAGAGALATQALANLAYGPEGLDLLSQGLSADEVVERLTGADEGSAHRQLGVVDAGGRAATFTGGECLDWAGGVTGDHFCCQGNILTGPDVVEAMAETFTSTEGELAVRLLAALRAGDERGGDSRGRQGAGIYVVREGGGYGGGIDKAVDLRVDDSSDPIGELERLWELHRLYFPRPEDLEFIPVDDELAGRLRTRLRELGYDPGDGTGYDRQLRDALWAYCGTENLEERWTEDPTLDRGILSHLLPHPFST
ncbi:MAG: DUF1028 domain-containing protein [Actinomycetota bacterium]